MNSSAEVSSIRQLYVAGGAYTRLRAAINRECGWDNVGTT